MGVFVPQCVFPDLTDPECLTGLWQRTLLRGLGRPAAPGRGLWRRTLLRGLGRPAAPGKGPRRGRGQGDCRVCSHSDTASVTRPSEGPVPIGARFHSDTDTAGSVFTVVPLVSQWCPWFHSGAPGFTAIPRRKCYSAPGLLVSSATVRRRVGGPWVTEDGGGQRCRQPLSAGPRRLELVAPPGCGNRHRCPILSRACC